jgi:hypothetical protein
MLPAGGCSCPLWLWLTADEAIGAVQIPASISISISVDVINS